MFAVVKTGGKQLRVAKGDVVRVEKLPLEDGAEVLFSEILLVEKQKKVSVGTPLVAGAAVKGKVVRQGRAKKITIRKYKPKKRYRKTQGHRQPFTAVKITEIITP